MSASVETAVPAAAAAAAIPSVAFDWLPLVLVAALMVIALPLVGSPSSWHGDVAARA